MIDIEQLKKDVSAKRAKMNAAAKRLKKSIKHGSEKQAATAEKHFNMWKMRWLRATVELNKAKKEAGTKFNMKRVLKGCLITGGVVLLGGVYMFFKGTGESVEEEPAEVL